MNFYDVLAAEKWDGGIPTMNFFDLLFAQSMGGGEQWQTYEGALPATLNANGSDLRQYQVWGNVNGVGDKTENEFNADLERGSINTAYGEDIPANNRLRTTFMSNLLSAGTYTLKFDGVDFVTMRAYDADKNYNYYKSIFDKWYQLPFTFTIDDNFYIRFVFRNSDDSVLYVDDISNIMLTEGATPPASYVPYGYKLDMATGSNILQSSEIEWGGWQAGEGTIPSKIVNPARCRSKNMYSISGKKIFYDFKSLNVNIAFVNSNERSLGGTGFKTGVGSVDVPENAVKCLFIIANTDASTNILPAQVIAAGIWASVDATTTPIYIGSNPLGEDEYIDYQAGKIYHMIDGVLTPTDPPVTLPALPTAEGETIIDYAGESVAPEKVLLEYKKGGN